MARNTWPNHFYTQIEPRELINFGPSEYNCQLFVPPNAEQQLKRQYGADCMTVKRDHKGFKLDDLEE